MKVPSFYQYFTCIADKCRDSCCIGWELDIDEDSYLRYRSEGGPFGERLRSHMEDIEEDGEVFHTFRRDGARCPFLNANNLCDIYRELGEDALCVVCTEYPRYTIRFGNDLECTLTLSCEEAGRLMFESEEPFRLVEPAEMVDIISEDGEDPGPGSALDTLRDIRETALDLLQDRTKLIDERLVSYLAYANQAQAEINGEAPAERSCRDTKEAFEERLGILDCLEILDEEWQSVYDDLCGIGERYEEILSAFNDDPSAKEERERSYEHLMSYFTLRYFPQALDDGDVLGKARFCLFCLNVIRDMDAMRLARKQMDATQSDRDQTAADPGQALADRIDTVRIFCKEVEHSDDNVAIIMEELLFAAYN